MPPEGRAAVEVAPSHGLTRSQVEERVARGQVNLVPTGPSRTMGDILRDNIVTRFNMLLGVLLVIVLFVAPIQDALFGFVLVGNTLIGIVQELRAKRTLDRLALLSAPRARVVRDGTVTEIDVGQVVLDDVLELRPGDQVVVDGHVLTTASLEINESLLTGESDAVVKQPGDEVLSGSFVVAGSGRYRATRVGSDAYAARLAAEARRFTLTRSELRRGIDFILAAIGWAIPPTMALLVWSQLEAADGVREALRASVAGAVGMVPQGLVLLTSIAFAVGVVRLGRRNTLVQELPAIEMLARVDTVCFDKTGTLTEGKLTVDRIIAVPGSEQVATAALGALAKADPTPNATLAAIGEAYSPPDWPVGGVVPFSSQRRWSGAMFDGHGTWVLGAPEVLSPGTEMAGRAAAIAEQGLRVLVLGTTHGSISEQRPPHDVSGVALVVLGDRVRDDVAATLQYFADQGVAAKVISGDNPRTVATIAGRVGMSDVEAAVDASALPEDPDELADMLEKNTIFGRVDPRQKRAMVGALQSRGHVVAMTGDGVNDVLALKDADIGIAMGSGSSASRAVAQLVLLDGAFDSLPAVVGEGRRVIANIERVANLFVTKTVYALLLALAIGVVGRAFPFVPRHLTLVGSITIGVPAFWLALAPTRKRAAPGFVGRVLRFAIPFGAVAAGATFAAYELAIHEEVNLTEARTAATFALAAVGMFALVLVSRPFTTGRRFLIGAMTVILVLVFVTPSGREFFELDLPGVTVLLATTGIVAIVGAGLYLALQALGWIQAVPELLKELPERTPVRLPWQTASREEGKARRRSSRSRSDT